MLPHTHQRKRMLTEAALLFSCKDVWVSVAECEQRLTLLRNDVDVCAVKSDAFFWNHHNNTVMIGTC